MSLKERVLDLVDEHGRKWTLIGEKLDEDPEKVRSAYRRAIGKHEGAYARKQQEKEQEKETPPPTTQTRHRVEFKEENWHSAEARSTSTRIRTLQELIETAQIDRRQWHVKRWIANSWEQGQKHVEYDRKGNVIATWPEILTLHQVKAFLERNFEGISSTFIEDLRNEVRDRAPELPPPLPSRLSDSMLEICVPDLHFGKYVWGEIGGTEYNMDEAERLFKEVIQDAAFFARRDNVEKILISLGNDLFHTDNIRNTTTKGTALDVHGDHRERYKRVRKMVRSCIELLHEICPVEIVIVPGNHDFETMYYLGDALEDIYYNTPTISVDNSPSRRKYVSYGVNLIGFGHGDKEKLNDLTGLMPLEQPVAWGQSKVREWHLGHIHTEKYFEKKIDERLGMRIRYIPSLSATDFWHHENTFVGSIREAKAFLWHKHTGLRAQYGLKADGIL